MSLKEKVLKTRNEAKCINCKNFEFLNDEVPYCNKSDKLILEMHIDTVRKCNNFEKREKEGVKDEKRSNSM